MKPKFRIGDRVKTNRGEDFVVIDIGDSWREDDPFTYLLAGEMGRFDGGYSAWRFGSVLELVGCGIPAPALRWEPIDKSANCFRAEIFGGLAHFSIISAGKLSLVKMNGAFIDDEIYKSVEEAKEACQAYWQELWDKEMLLSRDL